MTVRKFALWSLSTAACCALFGLMMPVTAHAFTIVTDGITNPDGSPKFADPDEKVEKFANGQGGGTSTTQNGGMTFQFNAGPTGPGGIAGNGIPPSMISRFSNPYYDPVPGYPTDSGGR